MKKLLIVMMVLLTAVIFAGETEIRKVQLLGGDIYKNIVDLAEKRHTGQGMIDLEIDTQCMAVVLALSEDVDTELFVDLMLEYAIDDPYKYNGLFDVPIDWNAFYKELIKYSRGGI